MEQGELARQAFEGLKKHVEDLLQWLDIELVPRKEYRIHANNRLVGWSRAVAVKDYSFVDHHGKSGCSPFFIVCGGRKYRLHCFHQDEGSNFDKAVDYRFNQAKYLSGGRSPGFPALAEEPVDIILAFIGPGFDDGCMKYNIASLEGSEKIHVFRDTETLTDFLNHILED
jgi:hypothetical protein